MAMIFPLNKPLISTIRNIGSETIAILYTKDLPTLETPNHYVLFADTSTLFIDNGKHQLTQSEFTGEINYWYYTPSSEEYKHLEYRGVIVVKEGVVDPKDDTKIPLVYKDKLGIVTDYWVVKSHHPTYIDVITAADFKEALIPYWTYFRISLYNFDFNVQVIGGYDTDKLSSTKLLKGLSELKSIVANYFVQYDSTFDINQYDIFKDIK